MRGNKRDIPRIPLPRPSAYPEVSSSTWKNKTEPQAIVINAVCQILNINKEWLTDGTGDMESGNQAFQSAKLLEELYDIAKELSEDEQLFLLDTVKALKLRLGKRQ